MKTPARPLLLAVLASVWALIPAVWAQNSSTPPPPDSSSTPAVAPAAVPAAESTTTEAAAPAPNATPADQPKSDAPATTAEPATPPPPATDEAAANVPATEPADSTETPAAGEPKPELRRLDVPEDSSAEPAEVAPVAPEAPDSTSSPDHRPRHRGRHGDARVAIWHDATLGAGETADAVVSVFGSSTSSGEVADAVVSIFGNTRVLEGEVGDAAVAVIGNNHVNGRIHGDVVAVIGNVELGPKAEVSGNVVCVLGTVKRDPGAVLHGNVNNVLTGLDFGSFEGLHSWVRHCLLLGRPLAFAPNLMWAWWIAIGALVLYVLLALLFPRGVVKCAETLEQRPGYSILTAFLVTLLTPAAAVLLLITIIGTPALILALTVAVIFGKVVMLGWIGRRITLRLGDSPLAHPALAVLIGGIIVMLLYTVPFLGFVLSKLISWIGLGVVVYTLIQSSKRAKPAPVARPSLAAAGVVAAPASDPGAALVGALPAGEAAAGTVPPVLPGAVPSVAPRLVSALELPRAGFWIRIAASLLDALVLLICLHLLPRVVRPEFIVVFAAYCAVFWGLRATTLGGIVCGLKVVRIDDRPVDWMTAIVRALAGFLSLIAVGIGFIWVAFDDQKQSWHDKIAGTTIVRVPKGVSLV